MNQELTQSIKTLFIDNALTSYIKAIYKQKNNRFNQYLYLYIDRHFIKNNLQINISQQQNYTNLYLKITDFKQTERQEQQRKITAFFKQELLSRCKDEKAKSEYNERFSSLKEIFEYLRSKPRKMVKEEIVNIYQDPKFYEKLADIVQQKFNFDQKMGQMERIEKEYRRFLKRQKGQIGRRQV